MEVTPDIHRNLHVIPAVSGRMAHTVSAACPPPWAEAASVAVRPRERRQQEDTRPPWHTVCPSACVSGLPAGGVRQGSAVQVRADEVAAAERTRGFRTEAEGRDCGALERKSPAAYAAGLGAVPIDSVSCLFLCRLPIRSSLRFPQDMLSSLRY